MCGETGSGSPPPAGTYRGGNQGGRDKFPMMAAMAVVLTSLIGMARHNSQPLGNRSGSGCG